VQQQHFLLGSKTASLIGILLATERATERIGGCTQQPADRPVVQSTKFEFV